MLDTGWRRLIECLELQVIFCKRAINYRTLLREMTCEDTASHAVIFATLHSDRYGDSTECTFNVHSICSKQTWVESLWRWLNVHSVYIEWMPITCMYIHWISSVLTYATHCNTLQHAATRCNALHVMYIQCTFSHRYSDSTACTLNSHPVASELE